MKYVIGLEEIPKSLYIYSASQDLERRPLVMVEFKSF
jgi:hypothetical protein